MVKLLKLLLIHERSRSWPTAKVLTKNFKKMKHKKIKLEHSRKFSKAVKEAAHAANALEIPEDERKDWMATRVLLALEVPAHHKGL